MLKNYLLTAYNVYMRRKLFTAINLLCITLTLTVLLLATALLQEALFPAGAEKNSDRFLQVTKIVAVSKNGGMYRSGPLGYKIIDKYLKPMKSAQLVGAVTQPETVSTYQGEHVTELQLLRTDAAYWRILDFNLLAGRVLTVDDIEQGRFVAVLNESTAKALFPGMQVVNRILNVGGRQFKIIGVVEDTAQLNTTGDIWTPITTNPSTEYINQETGTFTALILGESTADIPKMKAEIIQIAAQIRFDDPGTWNQAIMWGDSKLDFFARNLFGTERAPESGAGMLLVAVVLSMLFFMLLPALNLANLNSGRILERSTEIGVRKAFGASSNKLVIQFVVENILLCLIGGLLGLVCAKGVLVYLDYSGLIPSLGKVSLNLAVFLYGLIVTLVFGILSGAVPAWKMSRLNPVQALKGGA